ncbi:MAG: hypothetical protein JSR18_05240 [Proteobacteria bacterium]|nr:hypothetical protein [Pseudomonadota bacterium]
MAIADVSPIHTLRRLEQLELITYCSHALSFASFPDLERCSLRWRPRTRGLFDCPKLRRLFVDGYGGKDVSELGKLATLEALSILNAPIESLQDIAACRGLSYLQISNLPRLQSLVGIETAVRLARLEICGCPRIRSIDAVRHLKELETLLLVDNADIVSLEPLAKLQKLQDLMFYGSTNVVDGDLSILRQLPSLKHVAFKNRAHYSLTREQLGPLFSRM